MERNLIVSLVQNDIFWENKEKNFENISNLISKIEKTDLIILPEMFSTGFSMNVEMLAEGEDEKTFQFLREMAKQKDAMMAGSMIFRENNSIFNRFVAMKPDGEYYFYDKRHLFRMGNEDSFYSAGKRKTIFQWREWNICPLICYDLRFPVWSRNVESQFYDLLIYVANFPQARREVWTTLLKARAIENFAYLVGVNRIGKDVTSEYSGDSAAIHPKGFVLTNITPNVEMVETVELRKNEILELREKFPAYLDADKFEITN